MSENRLLLSLNGKNILGIFSPPSAQRCAVRTSWSSGIEYHLAKTKKALQVEASSVLSPLILAIKGFPRSTCNWVFYPLNHILKWIWSSYSPGQSKVKVFPGARHWWVIACKQTHDLESDRGGHALVPEIRVQTHERASDGAIGPADKLSKFATEWVCPCWLIQALRQVIIIVLNDYWWVFELV